MVSFVETCDHTAAKRRVLLYGIVDRLRSVVQGLWPRAHVNIFGSVAADVALPHSDVDVVIGLPKVHLEAGPDAPGALEGRNAIKQTWQQSLVRVLGQEDWVDLSTLRLITNTSVPVLKVCTRDLGTGPVRGVVIELDVSFEAPHHRGMDSCKLTSSLLWEYCPLRSLVLVLKEHLRRCALLDSYKGGLSSYAVVLLGARFLHELTYGMGMSPSFSVADPTNIGVLLLSFLDFFGNIFDPRAVGVRTSRQGCYFSRGVRVHSYGHNSGSRVHPCVNMGCLPYQHTARSREREGQKLASMSASLPQQQSHQPQQQQRRHQKLSRSQSFHSDVKNHIGYNESVSVAGSNNQSDTAVLSHFSGGQTRTDHSKHQGHPIAVATRGRQDLSVAGKTHHLTAGQSYQFDPLYIEDPLMPGNNVGRNCFRIFQVQRSFSQAHAHLESQLRQMEATGRAMPLLECLFD